ncbi:MAG: hypothetical protein JO309_06470 [Pseudonocardiales bacterium]|nr:hypothetical protein [Pseudonocardiales bacterium]MBV9729042.1 hypothetical protein [Pseudonocardiales bacterium]
MERHRGGPAAGRHCRILGWSHVVHRLGNCCAHRADGTCRVRHPRRLNPNRAPVHEIARLVGLGAAEPADDQDRPRVVLADPEGNELCIFPPSLPPARHAVRPGRIAAWS